MLWGRGRRTFSGGGGGTGRGNLRPPTLVMAVGCGGPGAAAASRRLCVEACVVARRPRGDAAFVAVMVKRAVAVGVRVVALLKADAPDLHGPTRTRG
jgi:hypothetical protein